MQTNTMTEVQVLGFVKEEGIWYADLPQFLEQGLGVKAEDRQLYFWRNYNQQEVDLVESFAGQLSAVEIKYCERIRKQKPKAFDQAYPDANFSIVDRDNYLDYIC